MRVEGAWIAAALLINADQLTWFRFRRAYSAPSSTVMPGGSPQKKVQKRAEYGWQERASDDKKQDDRETFGIANYHSPDPSMLLLSCMDPRATWLMIAFLAGYVLA
jgi:hypothetical protein